MKTLHNIFHNKLFKNYSLIIVGTVVSLIIGIVTTKMKADSSFMSLVNAVAYMIAAVGPLAILSINTNFSHNVKFLINQHFNRSELIKFFFFSQTLKVILGILNYGVLVLILALITDDVKKTISIPEINYLFSNFFVYFISILSGVYVLYFFALFNANKEDLQRVKVALSAMAKNKKKQRPFIIISFASLYIITSNDTVPDALKGYFWCLFISFSSLMVLNRTFKLFHPKKSYLMEGFGSFVLCFPLIGILYGMKKEAHTPDISYKLRADSVVYLSWMNTEFSEEQMLGFLGEVDNSNYNEILKLFGNQVKFDSSLVLVNNEYRGKKFIDFHSRKYSHDRVKKIVSHMSKLMKEKKLNFSFAQYSHSFFIKQKIKDTYIEELINSNDPYQQLASIYFAKNSFNKEKYHKFYKKNLALLDKSVINSRYVRRSIASEK